jgi:hypothetical protein
MPSTFYTNVPSPWTISKDPIMPRQLHGNPPLHALALDKDNFLLEGRGKGLAQDLGKFLSQDLKPVTGIEI